MTTSVCLPTELKHKGKYVSSVVFFWDNHMFAWTTCDLVWGKTKNVWKTPYGCCAAAKLTTAVPNVRHCWQMRPRLLFTCFWITILIRRDLHSHLSQRNTWGLSVHGRLVPKIVVQLVSDTVLLQRLQHIALMNNLCIARHYLYLNSSKSSGVLPVVQRLHPSQTRSWRCNLHHTGCVSLDYSPRRANHQTDDGCLGPSYFKVLQSPTLSRRSLGCRGNRSDLALSWNCQVLVWIALSEQVFRLLNKSIRLIREESCLLYGKAALSCIGWI